MDLVEIIISFMIRRDKMETKATFVLLLLVNMMIGDSNTGCPILSTLIWYELAIESAKWLLTTPKISPHCHLLSLP